MKYPSKNQTWEITYFDCPLTVTITGLNKSIIICKNPNALQSNVYWRANIKFIKRVS